MTSKRFLIAPVAALMVLGLAACGGGSSDSGSAGSKEPIKVGTEGVYSPFTYHDEKTNELTGYDVDVITAVGEKLGRKVEFSEGAWDSLFAGLESKRFDVIANQVTINDERKAKYSLSEPYTESIGVIVTRADDSSVTSATDLQGKTSAQSATSSFGEAAKAAGAKVQAVEGFAQSVTLLKQKRVDVTINDKLTALDYIKQNGTGDVKIAAEIGETTEQAFALRQDETDLTAEINTALDELRADGTLAKLSEKYFGEDVSGSSSSSSSSETATATPSPSES